MFDILLRKQFSSIFKRDIPSLLKQRYSDSAVTLILPKLKALSDRDSHRNRVADFKGNFIENLFINKFQETVLEYPQLNTIEEVNDLKKRFLLAEKIAGLSESKEVAPVDLGSTSAVTTLKKFELIGFKHPQIKEGFGYLQSEYTFLQEALGLDPSLSKTISEFEEFAIHVIKSFGSEGQKEQYLQNLVTGQITACFANTEKETLVSFEADSVNTTASLSSDTQNYVISGTKTWVYNAPSADLFILLANVTQNNGEKELKPTLFLVDKNLPGIEIQEPVETVGLKRLKISNVKFNNVVVPKSSVLGNVSEGLEIIKNALSQGKLSNGAYCIPIMKRFINKAIQHCIHNEFLSKDKHESTYFRIKIGKMISQLHVVESMTYLLTGRVDCHKNADVFLESLIIKIFASESLQFVMQQAIEILGQDFFTDDDNLVELSKDSQFYSACDDSNDRLRIILSTAGLKYAMKNIKERSFLEAFQDVFSKQNFKALFLQPEINYKNVLFGYLHLMFEKESGILEDCIYTLSNCTKFLIKTYGTKVFERHLELINLADIVIYIYAMTATLARVSRAYCNGVKFQELERGVADSCSPLFFLRIRNARDFILQPQNKKPNVEQISSHIMGSKHSDSFSVLRNLTVKN